MLAIVTISFIISMAIIMRQAISYWKMRQIHSFACDDSQGQRYRRAFGRIKKELHIKRPVRFVGSEYYQSPITYGILYPTIIFPMGEHMENDDDCCELLLRHELVHIRHHDLLIKFLGLLIVAVHWFNPFSYLMFSELTHLCEMYCDDTVIKGRGSDERYCYKELLLKLASAKSPQDSERFLVGMVSNKNKKNYKRRILEMSANRNQKTIVSTLMAMLICMAGGSVCFAYNPPTPVYSPDQYGGGEEFLFTADEFITDEEYLPYDHFFTDSDGNIYNVDEANCDAKASCAHDFSIHGVYSDHNRNNKGGCTVKKYEADKCSKCDALVLGKLLSTITYDPCPH